MTGAQSRVATTFYLLAAAVPALLSVALYRVVRALLGRAKARYTARHPETSRRWQIFSREFLEKPLVLPLLMTSAPRWNPHAVIGAFGPIAVREKIAIDGAAARKSGEWFFVIYRHPDRQTTGSLSHLNATGAPWEEFAVPRPGLYVIGARYYHPRSSIEFPAVRADGVEVGQARSVTPEINRFYNNLRTRENALYRFLAYYIWVLLRCRAHLPEAWVHREFLPVGNPETKFQYGMFRRGEPLTWRIEPDSCRDCDVYITLYSKGSFPIGWFELNPADPGPARLAPTDGFFLVRIQPRRRAAPTEALTPAGKSASVEIVPPLPNRPIETS